MSQRKKTEEFIIDARKAHDNKYDYSKVDYINVSTKVIIVCDCGNEFLQTPNGHLRGGGCPVCGEKTRIRNSTLSTPEFIEKAKNKHNDFYDYSLTIYTHNKKKVTIVCPIHGEFEQKAGSHLQGHGCQECALDIIRQRNSNSQEYFIEKSKEVQNNFYDYSLVEYTKADVKVKIICPVHGIFEQSPHLHMRGHGCRLCYNNRITGENSPLYKHGKSAELFRERDSPADTHWTRMVKKGVTHCDYCDEEFEKWNSAHAHHKNSWIAFPDHRHDVENGVVLCKTCHDLFHSIYGNGGTTEEQYNQFKKLKGILL